MWIFRSARTEAIGVRTAPGATNYITCARRERLRDELQNFARQTRQRGVSPNSNNSGIGHMSIPPDAPSNSVTFGATVTGRIKRNETLTLSSASTNSIFERDAVSWISPSARRCWPRTWQLIKL